MTTQSLMIGVLATWMPMMESTKAQACRDNFLRDHKGSLSVRRRASPGEHGARTLGAARPLLPQRTGALATASLARNPSPSASRHAPRERERHEGTEDDGYGEHEVHHWFPRPHGDRVPRLLTKVHDAHVEAYARAAARHQRRAGAGEWSQTAAGRGGGLERGGGGGGGELRFPGRPMCSATGTPAGCVRGARHTPPSKECCPWGRNTFLVCLPPSSHRACERWLSAKSRKLGAAGRTPVAADCRDSGAGSGLRAPRGADPLENLVGPRPRSGHLREAKGSPLE